MNMAAHKAMLARAGRKVFFDSPVTKCPCCPSTAPTTNAQSHLLLAMPVAIWELVPAAAHQMGVEQTESKWRISQEKARGKRGPPVSA